MTLKEIDFEKEPVLNHVAVKEAVLPFEKFAGADTLLGPEMKSTGEVRKWREEREPEGRELFFFHQKQQQQKTHSKNFLKKTQIK